MAKVKCNGKQIKLFNAFCISFMHIVCVLINSNEGKGRQKFEQNILYNLIQNSNRSCTVNGYYLRDSNFKLWFSLYLKQNKCENNILKYTFYIYDVM